MMERPMTCGTRAPREVRPSGHFLVCARERAAAAGMGRSEDGAPAMPLETATEPPFGNLKHQMNKLLDQMQKGFYTFSPGETWTPSVNLYENEVSYIVCADLAGVVKEEIDLQVHRQSLTLRGNRRVPVQAGDGAPAAAGGAGSGGAGQATAGDGSQTSKYRVHLMEIDHGPFVREVELPHDVESDRINATYKNGLLWIELPKKK
jgi:HSP20 family protein